MSSIVSRLSKAHRLSAGKTPAPVRETEMRISVYVI